MKKLLLILTMIIHCQTFAQYAKIVDKDGFVNVRNAANIKSKIVGKIKSDELVYIFDKGDDYGNWLIVDYEESNGNLLTGYIYKTRIKPVSTFEKIPFTTKNDHEVAFKLRDIYYTIKVEKFDYQSNKKYFSKTKYNNYEIEDHYKGQQIWGTDGTIPTTHYASVSVQIGKQKIKIPEKQIENLFNINTDNAKSYFDSKTETVYILMMNSDGAGTYEVLFMFRKGKYLGRRIYNSD